MDIEILELIDGAKRASGLTVIIDVFRAFSLEAYLYSRGAAGIMAVSSLETAFKLKEENPDSILIGERGGAMCKGCDYGNSPSQTLDADVRGKQIIHTTGAGTQGIINATGADEIITGSLVNASAAASYITMKNPSHVSIVAMGNAGVKRAREDVICAEYIRSLVAADSYDIDGQISTLRENGGAHFFNPETQKIFPKEDFLMCTRHDIFDFVIHAERAGNDMCHMLRSDISHI
jgi:2-phosphosulfolactate phosphatase